MKNDSSKETVHRLQALITREMGAPLKHAAEAKMGYIIRHACEVDGENIAPGSEPSFVQREVTILLADLRGFTAITATLPAGTVIAVLNRCLVRMSEIVSRHRGVIDKFIGDEVNLTSRIESFSLRGQVLISENTFDHCRDFVTVSEAMEVFVKGKTQPVKLRELYAIPSLNLEAPRKEVRHSKRMEVSLPCSISMIQNKIVMPKTISAIIRDIGYYGMLIEIDHPLKELDDVKLEFDLPLIDFKASDIYAKVVKLRHDGSRHLAGIEFTSISHETNMKIQLFVQLLVTAAA